jgi:peptidoglycan/LPS O-acetylase OafA/YrhL
MAKDKLYSVQYLRGLAVLLVVYVHAIILQKSCGTISFQQNFYFLKSIGAFGVDLFFIISGFIICYISSEEAGIQDFKYYIKKRFIRINPVFYVSCFFMFLCLLIWSPFEYSLDIITKSITIFPIFDSGEEFTYPLIYVGWTLSYEWAFYLFYGIFIAFSIVKGREIYLFFVYFLLFLAGFFFPVREIHYIFITNPMFLEFGAGMLIAVLYRRIKHLNVFIPFALGFIAIVIYVCLLFNGHGKVDEAYLINTGVYAWHRLFVFGIPTVLLFIWILFWDRKTSTYFVRSDKLALLGDASYSIYLVHPIFFFLLYHNLKNELALINPDLLIIILVTVSAILGILYHKLVENKLIIMFNTLLTGKRQKK